VMAVDAGAGEKLLGHVASLREPRWG
jgi:hypothetical protein